MMIKIQFRFFHNSLALQRNKPPFTINISTSQEQLDHKHSMDFTSQKGKG